MKDEKGREMTYWGGMTPEDELRSKFQRAMYWPSHQDVVMLDDALSAIKRARQEQREKFRPALELANRQANDEGLWFEARSITEAYLQGALRDLTRAIEDAHLFSTEGH